MSPRVVPFADRREAGKVLAAQLGVYAGRPDVVVLGLPRGGVPVAHEVARALRAPLDFIIVRKVGMPQHREFAIGAIASGGVQMLNHDALSWYQVPARDLDAVISEERQELARREVLYRGDTPPIDLAGKTVILVDDGLATGSSMTVAVSAVRGQRPAKIVVAVPVAAPEACEALGSVADAVVCARVPDSFSAVGLWYRDFSETSDNEVRTLLDLGRKVSHASR